jgi:cyclase
MIKIRIIPTILWEGISSVKGERFNSWRKLGPVMPAINIYIARNVDEIIILNLLPNKTGQGIDYFAIKKFFKHCNLPLTYGGGINNPSQIEELLKAGVDKVSIGTACYNNKELIRGTVSDLGNQFVVASIDYKRVGGSHKCFSRNGTFDENIDPIQHCLRMEDCGVGEILLNSCDHEGLMNGYDLEVIQKIRERVNVPIILSGGAGTLEHFYEAVSAGADAVAAASAFLFTEITPRKVAQYFHKHNIPARF